LMWLVIGATWAALTARRRLVRSPTRSWRNATLGS
jgi:hypothetical protein